MGKPFKIGSTPSGEKDKTVRAAPLQKVFDHVHADGDTLTDAGKELGAPDRSVGPGNPTEAGQRHGEDHNQIPVYPLPKEWPPAKPPDHKPMKLRGG